MSNQINTGTIVLSDAQAGGTVPLTLSFSLGAADLDAGRALLVVYDKDQYLENQATLPNGEVGDQLFIGKQTVFASPPQHTVQAGSGVLFMAEVTFKVRPQNGTRKTIDSFVELMQNVSVMPSPAFNLEIRCLNSVDAQGSTLSPKVIDVRPLAVSGPAQADFDSFTKSGDSQRSLTIRLLSIDRTRVMVSQLNPQQCFANRPIKIRYDADHLPAKVKQTAPSPAPATVPARPKIADITGEYVELTDPASQPTNPEKLLTASVLHVHHVGTQVCGWYCPLPNFVLAATLPSTPQSVGQPLFPPGTAPALGVRRGVFILGEHIAGTPRFNAVFVFRGNANAADELDPDQIIAQPGPSTAAPAPLAAGVSPPAPPVSPAELVPVNIAFEPATRSVTLPPDRIRISFPPLPTDPVGFAPPPDVVFARISGRSRLAWETVHGLATEAFVPAVVKQTARARIIEDFVEPLPPAVLGALISTIISSPMDQLVVAISQVQSNAAQISQRIAAVDAVNIALRNLAVSLRSIAGSPSSSAALSPTVIAQVRQAARTHTVTFEGNSTDMLSALQKISDDVVTRQIATDTTLPLKQHLIALSTSAQFDGFQAFNLLPQRNFIYRLTFTDQGSVSPPVLNFIILKGSLGAFLVTIDKLDETTQKQIPGWVPPNAPSLPEFGGFFAAGAIGLGYSIKATVGQGGVPSGLNKSFAAGATLGPMSVDFVSFSDLNPIDFQGANFTIFATGVSASVSGIPGKAGVKDIDAIFSLTTESVPPVTLEAQIKKGFQADSGFSKGQDLLNKIFDFDQQLNGGKPVEIAKASVDLTAASLCKGWLAVQTSLPNPAPRAPTPTTPLQNASVEINQVLRNAWFSRGSAVLTPEMRDYLELRLAVHRKMLEYPGWMDIEGLASPEYGDLDRATAAAKNRALSLNRANAVRDAIFDAAGAPGTGAIPAEKDIQIQGKGSQPFDPQFSPAPQPNSGLLLDPFTPGGTPAQITAREAAMTTMRRVDIAMNGVFTLRIPAKG